MHKHENKQMNNLDVWFLVIGIGFLLALLPYFCVCCCLRKCSFTTCILWFLNTVFLGILWHTLGSEWRGNRYWASRDESNSIMTGMSPWTSTYVMPFFVGLEIPSTEKDLRNVILNARTPIRIVGSGHSWSPTAYTDGTIVDIRKLNRVVNVDTVQMKITVQAGMKVQDAVQFLFARGFCFYGVGSIRAQSIGGIVSQGVHGPHPDGFNRHVVGMRVLLANGTFTEIHKESDLFMWRSSMGMLGVIVSVTIQFFPMMHLRLERSSISNFNELDSLGKHLSPQSATTFTAFLYPSRCGSLGWKRVGVSLDDPSFQPQDYQLKNQTDFSSRLQLHFNDHMHPAMQYMTKGILGTVVSCLEQMLADNGHSTLLSGPTTDVLPNDGLIPQFYEIIDYEYMVPLRHCRTFATELIQDQKYGTILVPVCLRLMRAEHSCLSIAEEDSCVFAVQTMRGMAYTLDAIAMEKRVGQLGGRAHFGKVAPGNFMYYTYPCIHKFNALRSQLDPAKKFLTSYFSTFLFRKNIIDTNSEFRPTLIARQYSIHRGALFFIVSWLISILFLFCSYHKLSNKSLNKPSHRSSYHKKDNNIYTRLDLYTFNSSM